MREPWEGERSVSGGEIWDGGSLSREGMRGPLDRSQRAPRRGEECGWRLFRRGRSWGASMRVA